MKPNRVCRSWRRADRIVIARFSEAAGAHHGRSVARRIEKDSVMGQGGSSRGLGLREFALADLRSNLNDLDVAVREACDNLKFATHCFDITTQCADIDVGT